MSLPIELEQEEDGRWIAEVPALPGVMAYGMTKDEATDAVRALALRTLADRVEHGEEVPDEVTDFFTVAA
ncbi:type II toxin-antitoxin system HicB family antitoxin [Zavarzinella formosa]|uniref:type II toxin-antitoxin system HicB family antitoxin n=1 Tax=Zavarzinella formosa TaxID=360055 RepID=UPI00030022A2|nr:type II toxin-antitoxin system HicB family antitoxin [Zavarzinella formosa]